MASLTLNEIWIYPIKSLGGIRVHTATVKGKGLAFDRRWMLIDQTGGALTQRVFPQLALFKADIRENRVTIEYTKGGQILSSTHFQIQTPASGNWLEAKVWDDLVEVLEVDPSVSEWFSDHLLTRCTLVAFPEEKPRPVDPRYNVNNQHVSLADGYPFLIIGEQSLEDLNKQLAEPVPMHRFRPNFVFAGGNPYEEDYWKNFSIGEVSFSAVKKCARCMVPTVNQDTGEKGPEPMRTLSKFRNENNKVYFGQNVIALNEGTVQVGDPVTHW
jgi:uncharacterized protein YcbX